MIDDYDKFIYYIYKLLEINKIWPPKKREKIMCTETYSKSKRIEIRAPEFLYSYWTHFKFDHPYTLRLNLLKMKKSVFKCIYGHE